MLNPIALNRKTLHTASLRAMNTDIDLTLACDRDKAASLEDQAKLWFQAVERRFSRFRPDSELSHLNTLAGKRSLISDFMLEVLILAEKYHKMTEGIFNPLIAKALNRAGYNQSFERLLSQTRNFIKNPSKPHPIERDFNKYCSTKVPAYYTLDPSTQTLYLSPETEIDLGGIVKGWAVKRLTDKYQNEFQIERGIVNAGGDLSVWGGSSDPGEPWLIGIENPWDPQEDIGTLALTEGSVATSSTLGRQWLTPQGRMHHLIDPRTMQPSTSDIVQCTVFGPDVIECEIWAKVFCIVGLEKGQDLFSNRKSGEYAALLFTTHQKIHYFGKSASIGKHGVI